MGLGFIWIPYILMQKIKNNAVPASEDGDEIIGFSQAVGSQ